MIRKLALSATLCLLLSFPSRSQSSEYFIVDGGSGVLSVVQNGAVVRSFNQRNTGPMPIAVAGTIRTYAQFAEIGSEYDLAGNWTGTDYPFGGPTGQNVDGATDGVQNNWIAAWNQAGIYRTDRDWQNPTLQFAVPGGPTGVAYDGNTGNLWVIDFANQVVAEYDLGGNVLSFFLYSSASAWLGCLAWEPATDTLWATDFSNGDVYQFDKAGNVLQTLSVPAIAGYAWGGEFDYATCTARWFNYGQGFPGTTGIPNFVASNAPQLGQPITLTADNSSGGATIPGFLPIGLQQIQVPGNWGGDLLVSPLVFMPVAIPPAGLVLSGIVPNDPNLCDLEVYFQVLELDAGAAQGVSNTPGLALHFGN